MNKQMTHFWNWKKRLPERKGQPCRVLARGKLNSILIEFEDGYKVVTSRFAVRKIIPLLVLIMAQIACMTTVEPYATYPADTPAAPTQTAIIEEPASGAVFEIDNQKSQIENCAIVIASQSLHLRAQPSEKSQVLKYLYHGDQVKVLARELKWWSIQAGDKTGWAKAEFLAESECE